jgi:hypothetical protein
MEQWWNDTDRGKLKYWKENLSQCNLFHHKSHIWRQRKYKLPEHCTSEHLVVGAIVGYCTLSRIYFLPAALLDSEEGLFFAVLSESQRRSQSRLKFVWPIPNVD